jgi:hypothetical protein
MNMPNTNVELSKNEMELVCNSEFILTKNRIIEKVYNLFGDLSEQYKTILNEQAAILPAEIFKTSTKIYKGENYLSLPYVMMDQPRMFLKEDVFAIRSFFWWGNYFSITLQLSGKYLDKFRNNIQQNLQRTNNSEYFICVNNNEWQHHFENDNYKPLKEINVEEILQKQFLKIAAKTSLQNWNTAEGFFKQQYIRLLQLLSN